MPKLLFLAGSARKESLNKKLVHIAAELAEKKGCKASVVDLNLFQMPIYDGDYEDDKGIPDTAILLKKVFQDHDGIFISSPEYNSSFSPLLKNALDWISRPHEENEPSLSAYRGKIAALASISPGGLGGLRGLVPLRMMLGNIGVTVIPQQVAIGNGFSAFNDDGTLADERQAQMLEATINELINTTRPFI